MALFKNLPCRGTLQADQLGDGYQVVDLGKIHVVDEVCLEERHVDPFAVRLGLGPLSEFLGEAAVVRHGPHAIGEPLVRHQLRQVGLGHADVEIATGEQFLQRQPRFGCVRMQWEVGVDDIDGERPTQLFRTARAEITPRSDVIGEDLECGHVPPLLVVADQCRNRRCVLYQTTADRNRSGTWSRVRVLFSHSGRRESPWSPKQYKLVPVRR